MFFYQNIIIGAGPSGLQLGYFFQKYFYNYLIIEKSENVGNFFCNFPHSKKLSSLYNFNKKSNLNSLINYENLNFEYDMNDDNESELYYNYLNKFYKTFNLNIVFNTTVINIIKRANNKYYIITDKDTYYCNKLIIATGLSIPNMTSINFPQISNLNIKHYSEFENNYFLSEKNLINFNDKNVLIIGNGNSSFEISKLISKYTKSITIVGKNKELGIKTNDPNDIYINNLSFLDNNLNNSIKIYNEYLDGNYQILISEANNSNCTNKFFIKYKGEIVMYENAYWDYIILCTGFKFNKSIFDKSLGIKYINNYPQINNLSCESIGNKNLFFIGSLVYNSEIKKSFNYIYQFKNLIENFFYNHYISPVNFKTSRFGVSNNLLELTNFIINNIESNNDFSICELFCDMFKYNNLSENIIYFKKIPLKKINNYLGEDIKFFGVLKCKFDTNNNTNFLNSLNLINSYQIIIYKNNSNNNDIYEIFNLDFKYKSDEQKHRFISYILNMFIQLNL